MDKRVKLGLTAGFLGSALMLGAATVMAAGDGATAIKERQAIMKSIGAHMGGIKAGIAAGDGKAVAGHAKGINALAGMFSFMSAALFSLFAMWFDMESNRDLK